MNKYFTSAVLLSTLVGCAEDIGGSFDKISLPQKWLGNSGGDFAEQNNKYSQHEWWKAFDDEILNKLVDKAIANNQNKKIAGERLVEARALRESAFAGLFPEVNLGGTAKRGKEGILTQGKTTNFFDTRFDASYELDLFGKTTDKVSAANAKISSVAAEYQDFTISLIAEVAREYTDFRNYKMQCAVLSLKIKNFKEYVKLQHALVAAGLTDKIKLAEAEANLQAAQSELPKQENLQRATEYRLAVLVAGEPAKIHDILADEKPIPTTQKLPALAAPAKVILNRPDVIAAEKNFEATTALYQAQTKEIFPHITISSLFGFQDAGVIPGGKIWSVGGNFTAPLLNFGRIESQIEAAKSQEKQAFYAYKQKILEAVAEVETSLTRYSTAQTELAATGAENDSNAKQLQLAKDKYKSGLVSYLEVILAEQKYLDSLTKLSAAETSKTQASIAIYKALAVK